MRQYAPLTSGGAWRKLIEILSPEGIAAFLGLKSWAVYNRCKAESAEQMNITFGQALELSVMSAEKSGNAPLLDLFAHTVEAAMPDVKASEEEVTRDVLLVNAEVGTLSQALAVIQATQAKANRKGLSEGERKTLLKEVDELTQALKKLARDLTANLREVK